MGSGQRPFIMHIMFILLRDYFQLYLVPNLNGFYCAAHNGGIASARVRAVSSQSVGRMLHSEWP